MNLRKETIRLLEADERPDSEVARLAKVPAPWLCMFRSGKIKNPGADRVQVLYEFLSGRSLLDG